MHACTQSLTPAAPQAQAACHFFSAHLYRSSSQGSVSPREDGDEDPLSPEEAWQQRLAEEAEGDFSGAFGHSLQDGGAVPVGLLCRVQGWAGGQIIQLVSTV